MEINQIKDVVDYGIIGLLIFLSILTVTFAIERILFFRSVDIEEYRHKLSLELDLTKRLGTIATIGTNAPYIGLLGTVNGIIITFYIMGESGEIDVKSIMTSLALALKATAMGLLVAIPAIFLYSHLTRKIEVLLAKWEVLNKDKNFAT